MNDLNNLLRAIITNPDADDPRLMYADALDELPTKTVPCPDCKGETVVEYTSHPKDYGNLKEYHRHGCTRCHGTGTVTDTTNRDRAEFIRKQVRFDRSMGEMGRNEFDALNQRLCDLWNETEAVTCYMTPVGLDALRRSEYGFNECELPNKGLVVRGFVDKVSTTAEQFLAHADELVWHPTQMVECGRCAGDGKAHGSDRPFEWSADPNYMKCPVCVGSGLVPRPCPDTAQPIRKVVLTTVVPGMGNYYLSTDDEGRKIRRYHRWPGIEFELPSRETEDTYYEDATSTHQYE